MSTQENIDLPDFVSDQIGRDSGISSFSSDCSDSVHPSSFLLDSVKVGPSSDINDMLVDSEKDIIFQVNYLGEHQLSRRHTPLMIPWVVEDVHCRNECEPVIMNITKSSTYSEHSVLKIRTNLNQSGRLFVECRRKQVELGHAIKNLTRFSKSFRNPRLFSYLFRQSSDLVFTCFVYKASNEEVVNNIFYAIHNAMLTAPRIASEPSSPSLVTSQNLYDVVYIGKVVVSTKKAPPTFLDEAIKKFDELAKQELENETKGNDLETIQESQDEGVVSNKISSDRNISVSKSTNTLDKSPETVSCEAKVTKNPDDAEFLNKVKPTRSNRKSSIEKGCDTLLQIGQDEISLLSSEFKHLLKEWKFKDISFCSQGIICCNHFGFISRNPGTSNYICYIFKCSSESLVDEIMLTMRKAFQSAFEKSSRSLVVCELCPMHQLHKLCLFLENMDESMIFKTLSAKFEHLSKNCDIQLLSKERSSCDVPTLSETNVRLMSSLLKLCERQQEMHDHINDNKRNNQESFDFLMFPNKQEERKETNEALLRLEDINGNEFNLERLQLDKWADKVRQRRHSVPHSLPINSKSHETLLFNKPRTKDDPVFLCNNPTNDVVFMDKFIPEDSPIRSMFMKVGNAGNLKTKSSLRHAGRSSSVSSSSSSLSSPSLSSALNSQLLPKYRGAWQINILSSLRITRGSIDDDDFLSERKEKDHIFHPKSTWKKAIGDTILLIKINKKSEDKNREDEIDGVGCRVNYQEVTPCLKEVTRVWKQLLESELWKSMKLDYELLAKSVKDGVPKEMRGRIWKLLVLQNRMHNNNNNTSNKHGITGSTSDDSFSCDVVDYEILKRQLTSHQHAILIDLGRTFPGHPYFATSSGPGQAALFNVLKAYSVLDVEVGYCQGLSFVAGVLLIHVGERDAFEILKHVMFRLGFRRQYKPDMVPLQIRMYQLTRMLHDSYRDLYEHLEAHQIAPTLYAAPWFLTIFASQFPLGFVARIIDLIFTFGTEIILKVALVLLGNHKELIKQCSTLESIVDFLKTTLPDMAIIQMERIFNQVFQLDISKTLEAYEVEYHILHEEMGGCSTKTPPSNESHEKDKLLSRLSRVQLANDSLRRQKMELLEQLQTSRRQMRMSEAENSALSSSEIKLKSQNRVLELERTALLVTIEMLRQQLNDNSLKENNKINNN